jgi:hypothetical protein
VLRDIAEAHGGVDLIPLVVLSWGIQRGILVLPRSATSSHIMSNARLLGNYTGKDEASMRSLGVFLDARDLARIDALDGAVDAHRNCAEWAAEDECNNNPGYMLNNCPASCKSLSSEPLGCDGRTLNSHSASGIEEL